MLTDALLKWGPDLQTGVPAIDEQHQILVEMINEANVKLREAVEKVDVERMVRDLMNYALYHFDTEEELMVANDYLGARPEEAAKHSAEHRSFSETVANLHRDLTKGAPVSREGLMTFLNNWLVNHILKSDMRLADFLKSAASS